MSTNSSRAGLRERFEFEQLIKIAADWKCQACGSEHGKLHSGAPSIRVFLIVVNGQALCQVCRSDDVDGA